MKSYLLYNPRPYFDNQKELRNSQILFYILYFMQEVQRGKSGPKFRRDLTVPETIPEMQKLIEEYFNDCNENKEPLTTTGLALALGFNSRQSLLNYEAKPELMDTIKKAKSYIEKFNEKALYSKKVPTVGVIFNLANNHRRENKQTIDNSVTIAEPNYNKIKDAL